jgi:PAS domain S-box-containing protein
MAPDTTVVIVSAGKCHKVIHISTELSKQFGYEAAEICGRSLSILQGPKTDSKALHYAIKSATMLSPADLSLVMYSREGSELAMTASCFPITSNNGEVTGCRLQIREASMAQSPLSMAPQKTTLASNRRIVLAYRKQYNFHMGLVIDHVHRQRGCVVNT